MAGRGVDIKLGGNPEHLAQVELRKLGLNPGDDDYDEHYAEALRAIEARVADGRERVLEAGGLYICGTERHESRRIDNQLRGRSGRQGDPGEIAVLPLAEDDLVRLFAGDRIYKILDRLGGVDEEGNEEPIEASMLSVRSRRPRRKVEEQNFLDPQARARVRRRHERAARGDLRAARPRARGSRTCETTRASTSATCSRASIDEYTPGDYVEDWDLGALFGAVQQILPVDFSAEDLSPDAARTRAARPTG